SLQVVHAQASRRLRLGRVARVAVLHKDGSNLLLEEFQPLVIGSVRGGERARAREQQDGAGGARDRPGGSQAGPAVGMTVGPARGRLVSGRRHAACLRTVRRPGVGHARMSALRNHEFAWVSFSWMRRVRTYRTRRKKAPVEASAASE